jgi:hypothetical protein
MPFVVIPRRLAPREKQEDARVHSAGRIGLLAAVALFGVDCFTSYFYATGEMMSELHPFGLEPRASIVVTVIAFANFVCGLLYMYSLGIFNEGGGSYTASMRYLSPGLSLVVAVVLIQDYVLTIVVSTLSGVDMASRLPMPTRSSGTCALPWVPLWPASPGSSASAGAASRPKSCSWRWASSCS